MKKILSQNVQISQVKKITGIKFVKLNKTLLDNILEYIFPNETRLNLVSKNFN